jgi:AcrR family transcriptional regulator
MSRGGRTALRDERQDELVGTSISPEMAERLRAVAAETLSAGPVNISAVAAATGVPRSTLYYNFKGADELTRWFVDELLVEIGERMAAAVAAEVDPPAQLAAAIHTLTDVTVEQRSLTEALLRGVFSGPDFADRLRMTRDTVFPAVRETLERGIADGSFVDVDIDETIAGFIGTIAVIGLHHLGTLGPADPVPPPNDFISLMLASLQNPEARRSAARAELDSRRTGRVAAASRGRSRASRSAPG